MLKGWTTGRLLALIRRFTGNLSSLTTSSKADLVSAINSLNPQFSATPVYDVTLAEDVSVRKGSMYSIEDLGGEYTNLRIFIVVPQSSYSGTVYASITLDTSDSAAAVFSFTSSDNDGSYNCIDVYNNKGMLCVQQVKSNHTYSSGNVTSFPQYDKTPFIKNGFINSIQIGTSNTAQTIPAGTRITIYAAS